MKIPVIKIFKGTYITNTQYDNIVLITVVEV